MESSQQIVEKVEKTTFVPLFLPLPLMLNRKTAPEVHPIGQLTLPQPTLRHLSNGIPVHILDYPGQEVLKVEVVFKAGRPEEHRRMVARTTSRLIREGNQRLSGAEIAEWMEYYGSSFSNPTNLDSANFVLYTLRKYAQQVIPVFAETIIAPAFPQKELDIFCTNSLRELQVELDKEEVIAYRQITENMFGLEHPYGYNSSPEDYQLLRVDDLHQHHRRWYTPANCTLFISGDTAATAGFDLLEQFFGAMPPGGNVPSFHWDKPLPSPSTQHIPHEGSLQTAIKIGRRLFNRQHPDYNGIFILNTILGGYFGSRLMNNIREKKGYTYNIYSTADAMGHGGYLYIATEVNPGKTAATIRQIFKEMKALREKPVPETELEMVRNYLLGMLLNGLDGPMNTADVVKGLICDDLPLQHFEALVEDIRNCTAGQIQELANRYLAPEDFWVVTVG
ncbi:MAG: insulinase family protein [Lewinellaceae bacterium]|nr:insulinase family protein [Lewinellaceae bacterium]